MPDDSDFSGWLGEATGPVSLVEKARRYATGVGTFSRAEIGKLADMFGDPEPGTALLHGIAAEMVVDAGVAEYVDRAGQPDPGQYHRVRWLERPQLDDGVPDPLHSLTDPQRIEYVRAHNDRRLDTPITPEFFDALRALLAETHWFHALAVRGQAYRLGMEFFQEMATVLANALLGDDELAHDLGAWVQALPPERRNVLAQLLDALDVNLDDLDPPVSTEPKACVPVPCPPQETTEISAEWRVIRLEDGAEFPPRPVRPWTFDVEGVDTSIRTDYGTGTEPGYAWNWAIHDGPDEINDVVICGHEEIADPTPVLARIVAQRNASLARPAETVEERITAIAEAAGWRVTRAGKFLPPVGGSLVVVAPTGSPLVDARPLIDQNYFEVPPSPLVLDDGRIRGVSIDTAPSPIGGQIVASGPLPAGEMIDRIDQAEDTVSGLMDRLADSVDAANASLAAHASIPCGYCGHRRDEHIAENPRKLCRRCPCTGWDEPADTEV